MEHVSVVIVNWNAGARRPPSTPFFASAGGDPHQVIRGQCSTDGSQASLAYPAVEVIQNTKNVGFAKAVNQAPRRGAGSVFIVLNPDARL